MQRNIDRRVEVLFPVEDQVLRAEIIENILNVYLRDTEKGYLLDAAGNYTMIRRGLDKEELSFNSQEWFLNGRVTFQQQVDVTTT